MHTHLSQTPRFGNGRTITDLAKRIFTEIGMRIDQDGNAERDIEDSRALAEDIRRSVAVVLTQLTGKTSGAGTRLSKDRHSRKAPHKEAFSATSSEQAPRKAPTSTVTQTKQSRNADGEKCELHEHRGELKTDPSLSEEDRKALDEACKIAGISVDSPELSRNPEDNENLQRVLVLPRAEGGMAMSPDEAKTLLRKVVADRMAFQLEPPHSTNARDIGPAERAAEEAEVNVKKALSGGDEELLKHLMSVKRARDEILRKAKEERERQLAMERAAQEALRRMGVCPAGFKWRRQGNGWRCSAGGHYVTDATITAELARKSSR